MTLVLSLQNSAFTIQLSDRQLSAISSLGRFSHILPQVEEGRRFDNG
jgi:hypothetical protein